ncbi:hypothetical protein P3764_01970 [Pseudomonas aeruginosa]|uniref:DUF6631 family protein n=1 Tax=Pseudomonas aeruginosa TaxID=287 RepID=UPI00071B63B0|nr:DUF6631 family protein [Pseudomonas aeruginosa]KSC42416.1 hypothetical protein AO881_09250 [Pseudomonas aeruginosa]MDP5467396.1 hypothetical protein [Pseudomonas aeruginosa]HCF7066350.1 hypothetical protein [Pseudomonas aeruginosa]
MTHSAPISDPISDLDVLVPQAQVLELAGQRLTIRALVVGELPAMLKAVRPFAEQLTGEPDWLALLCDHGDALLAALALASRQPRDWVDALALDEAITLAAAVFEVNADFFVRRVAPKVGDLAQSLNGQQNRRSAGSTPSRA